MRLNSSAPAALYIRFGFKPAPVYASTFDPYLAQRRCRWRNRRARWRQAPGETAFHAAVWLALIAMMGSAAVALDARRDLAEDIVVLVHKQPWAWMLAWGGLIAMQVRRGLRFWQAHDAAGWLAAQPVAARVRARERWRVAWRCVWPHGLGGMVLFGFLRLAWPAWGGLVFMLAMAAIAGALWARRGRVHAADGARHRNDHLVAQCDVGRGCLWRWQRRAALAGIGPHALRHGLWMLLLIPVGASAFAAAVALASGLALAAFLSAWRRCLAVLVQAEGWLGAQPSPARFWMSGMLVPMAMAAFAAGIAGAGLGALGAARVAPWIGLALFALALLQALCTLAWRRTPARIALASTLHLVLLAAAWQGFAPLVLPLWLAMCLRLLRRGVRA